MGKVRPKAEVSPALNIEGLTKIAETKKYAIYDDKKENRAVIIVVANPGRKNETLRVFTAKRPKRKLGWKLLEYIASFASLGPLSLIPFILENESMMKLARYLYRHGSRSLNSLRSYAITIKQFSRYAQKSPDELVRACLAKEASQIRRKFARCRPWSMNF